VHERHTDIFDMARDDNDQQQHVIIVICMLFMCFATTYNYDCNIEPGLLKICNDEVKNAIAAEEQCKKTIKDLENKHQSTLEALAKTHQTKYDQLNAQNLQQFNNAKTDAENRFTEAKLANEQKLKSMLDKTEKYVSSFEEYVTSIQTFINAIGLKCKNSKSIGGHMHGENNRLLIGMTMHTMAVDPSCESLFDIKKALMGMRTRSVKYSDEMKELHKNSNIGIDFEGFEFGQGAGSFSPGEGEKKQENKQDLLSALSDSRDVLAVAATSVAITAFTGFYWLFKMSMPIQHSKRDAVVNGISGRPHIRHRV
jgi:hypothetical protein